MKKFFKVLGIILLVLIVIIIGGYIYFISTYPDVGPAPNIKVELTKDRIERGRYLANHVTMCMDCHSNRDWTKYAGPPKPGSYGKGGDVFGKDLGFPGTLHIKNITPYNLKNWTDGEIFRALTSGVNKDGDVLFPVMPYMNFSQLTREDLYSIIAYLRTLEPIKNDVPKSEIDFPVNLLVRMAPKAYKDNKAPDKSNPIEYGKYLVTSAGCADCHTPSEKGEPVKGKEFAGGSDFVLPWGTIRPANITPDKETGIGNWTKEYFISRFRNFSADSAKFIPVKSNEFNSIMPWTLYGGMTVEDLSAVYDYLHSAKAIKNQVIKYTPAKNNESAGKL